MKQIFAIFISNIFPIISILCATFLLYKDKKYWWFFFILAALTVVTGGK